jgi:putative ABC transport system substrate-binding protein
MRRREFMSLLGGAAVAWPIAVSAQQMDRMRRVGVLLPARMDDSEYPGLVQAFLTELKQLGWINNVNIAIDFRWVGAAADDLERVPANWPRLHLMSFWLRGTRRSALCCRQPGQSPWCL